MQCYTNSLNKSPPNTHRVQKCLQKLLRSMHKDRHHTIQHYKHLLETNMEQADREKEITIEHLADIDRFECFATIFKDEPIDREHCFSYIFLELTFSQY